MATTVRSVSDVSIPATPTTDTKPTTNGHTAVTAQAPKSAIGMDANRRTALSTGVLFIVATLAALLAAALAGPDQAALTGADYLTKVSANVNQVAGGALSYVIAALASVGIAVAMYPVLKERNAGLALGSVVFRTIEAVMYMVAVVSLLSVLSLSQHFAAAGTTDRAALQAVGDSLLSVRDNATLAAVFAFSLGAFLYYYVFFLSRLVPRWLSGWGIVASILMMAACLLALFSTSPVTGYTLLILPIAVQEMVLAVWLIAKGFNPAAIASASAKQERASSSQRA